MKKALVGRVVRKKSFSEEGGGGDSWVGAARVAGCYSILGEFSKSAPTFSKLAFAS